MNNYPPIPTHNLSGSGFVTTGEGATTEPDQYVMLGPVLLPDGQQFIWYEKRCPADKVESRGDAVPDYA